MAASVRIEDEAFSDERYEDLAQFAGLTDADHARGKMARIWRQCTIEGTHTIANHLVIRVLGTNGIDALVRSRLGEKISETHVRVRGTEGRIEWLKRLRENGNKGGRPKGSSTKPSGSVGGKPSGSKSNNPPAPAPVTAPTSSDPSLRDALVRFDALFHASSGSKPTWGDRQCGQLKQLVTKHGSAEVIRRTEVLFSAPPRFLAGSQPDMDTLVQHFDKLVKPASQTTLSVVAPTPRQVKEIK